MRQNCTSGMRDLSFRSTAHLYMGHTLIFFDFSKNTFSKNTLSGFLNVSRALRISFPIKHPTASCIRLNFLRALPLALPLLSGGLAATQSWTANVQVRAWTACTRSLCLRHRNRLHCCWRWHGPRSSGRAGEWNKFAAANLP